MDRSVTSTSASEKYEIDRDGGKSQANSGRGKHNKGDAILKPFLVDIKEYNQSFSVSRSVWAKLVLDTFKAGGGGLLPALKIVLGQYGQPKLRLWVVEEGVILDYIRLLEKEEQNA